jgi:hypothetical protein
MPYRTLALTAGLLAQTLSAASAAAAGNVAVFAATPSRPTLELADGCRVSPELPAGAEVRRAALLADRWQLVGTQVEGSQRRLLLLQGRCGPGGQERAAAGPRIPAGVSVDGPELLADREPRALAWLQGNDPSRLAVMASEWLGDDRWQAPVEVAAPAAGSQLALSGAVLDDASHSRLLVWSRFDGHDDEIVWSTSTGGAAWSAPLPVASDNAVPDISPSLLAVDGGALLVWSRYDGNDYRVVVSRWQDGHFSPPRTIGPRGSVFPTLATDGRQVSLLYRTAAPGGWGAASLGVSGDVLRRAAVESARQERPVLGTDDAGIALRWTPDEVPTRARWTTAEP